MKKNRLDDEADEVVNYMIVNPIIDRELKFKLIDFSLLLLLLLLYN